MTLLVLFWICVNVVMSYVYNLSRNFWDCVLEFSGRLSYAGVVLHAISSWVCFMGNVLFAVTMYILYSLFSKKSVRTMGDLVQACCRSLGR